MSGPLPAAVPLSLLCRLHERGRLLPLLREAVAEQTVLAAAQEAGLSVSDAELQAAADRFRHRHGLSSADATHAWLDREGRTPLDLQANLEADLLTEKFRDHLGAPHAATHFAVNADRYARARLRMLVAASEGEARERLTQVRDEGRDFAELARRHSLHLTTRPAGGDLGEVFRRQLPARVGEATFAARSGDVVGPIPGEGGFCIFLVEAVSPPALDAAAALVRAELFDGWVRERLADVRFDLSWLKATHDSV